MGCWCASCRYAPQPGFRAGGAAFTATLEAVLLGHEDWVFSAAWQPGQSAGDAACSAAAPSVPCLLSASMDRTMMLWRPEASTGEHADVPPSCALLNMHNFLLINSENKYSKQEGGQPLTAGCRLIWPRAVDGGGERGRRGRVLFRLLRRRLGP